MPNYNKLTPELAEKLREIVGGSRFRYGDAVNAAYNLMGAIKRVFDPECILNPGKVCT